MKEIAKWIVESTCAGKRLVEKKWPAGPLENLALCDTMSGGKKTQAVYNLVQRACSYRYWKAAFWTSGREYLADPDTQYPRDVLRSLVANHLMANFSNIYSYCWPQSRMLL